LRYFSRTVVGIMTESASAARLRSPVPAPAVAPVASPSVTGRVAVPVAVVADCATSVEPVVFLPEVTDPAAPAGSVPAVVRPVVVPAAAESVVVPPILVGPPAGLVEVPDAVVDALLEAASPVLGTEGSVAAAADGLELFIF
jgi:hypothetical protein